MKRILAPLLSVAMLVAFAGPVLAQESQTFTFDMNGGVEVPPGDPTGTGTATVTLSEVPGTICVDASYTNISLPVTGAHIHQAPAGEAGSIVVPFIGGGGPLGPVDDNSFSTCVPAAPDLIEAIAQNPGQYYLNLHNADFPPGALRGQLVQ